MLHAGKKGSNLKNFYSCREIGVGALRFSSQADIIGQMVAYVRESASKGETQADQLIDIVKGGFAMPGGSEGVGAAR